MKERNSVHLHGYGSSPDENLCKHYCQAPTLIFLDCGIMQSFDFCWWSSWLRISPPLKKSMHCWLIEISSFYEKPRIRAIGYYYTPFHIRTLLQVKELICEGFHGWKDAV